MEQKNKEWKAPQETGKVKLPPFPTNCLPKLLKDYTIQLAEEIQVSEDMVGSAILGILSICNQSKYVVRCKKGWEEPLNQYILIIAEPSERKSPVCKRLTKPIYDYEKEKNKILKPQIIKNSSEKEILQKRLSKLQKDLINKDDKKELDEEKYKKEIEKIQQEIINFKDIQEVKIIADDVTPEALISTMMQNNDKMAIVAPEGGIFATMGGRYNNNIPNCDVFLKSYSKETIKRDRQGKETETMYEPVLTMLLFVQPIILEKVFSNAEFRGTGLCARFLYSFLEPKIGTRKITGDIVNEEIEENYKLMINQLLDKTEKDIILTLSEEAYKKFADFWYWNEKKSSNELSDMKDWTGKLGGMVLRIAGNLHVVENYNNGNHIINETTMENAINLAKYYLAHSQNIYFMIGTSLEEQKAKRIIKILKDNNIVGKIKRHDLFRKVRGNGIEAVEDIIEPLNLLKECGYIRELQQEREGVGRKPDIIIELNPLVFNSN